MNLPFMKVGRAILALTLLRSVRSTGETGTSVNAETKRKDFWYGDTFIITSLTEIKNNGLKVRKVKLDNYKNVFPERSLMEKLEWLEVEELKLCRSSIDLAIFKEILTFGLPKLEILCLTLNPQLGNEVKRVEDLSFLQDSSANLKKLYLPGCGLDKTFFIGVLKYLPNLKELCFNVNSISGITNEDLSMINENIKLEILELQYTDLDLASFKVIVESIPTLKNINISWNESLKGSKEDFKFLESKEHWNIENINIEGCSSLTNDAQYYIQNIPSINRANKQKEEEDNRIKLQAN